MHKRIFTFSGYLLSVILSLSRKTTKVDIYGDKIVIYEYITLNEPLKHVRMDQAIDAHFTLLGLGVVKRAAAIAH